VGGFHALVVENNNTEMGTNELAVVQSNYFAISINDLPLGINHFAMRINYFM
jgi:hypothetical protein